MVSLSPASAALEAVQGAMETAMGDPLRGVCMLAALASTAAFAFANTLGTISRQREMPATLSRSMSVARKKAALA